MQFRARTSDVALNSGLKGRRSFRSSGPEGNAELHCPSAPTPAYVRVQRGRLVAGDSAAKRP
eukprot:8840056-Alexandrium_andersonii.AAC.1